MSGSIPLSSVLRKCEVEIYIKSFLLKFTGFSDLDLCLDRDVFGMRLMYLNQKCGSGLMYPSQGVMLLISRK